MNVMSMSGRIYNAMMKFAGGTKTYPQLANLFFFNGKVYATNSIAMCRWTPATKYVETTSEDKEVTNAFYFTPRMSKVPAGTTIYIDSTMLDIDKDSAMLNDPDKVMDGTYKHPLSAISGINPDYLAAIAALGRLFVLIRMALVVPLTLIGKAILFMLILTQGTMASLTLL